MRSPAGSCRRRCAPRPVSPLIRSYSVTAGRWPELRRWRALSSLLRVMAWTPLSVTARAAAYPGWPAGSSANANAGAPW